MPRSIAASAVLVFAFAALTPCPSSAVAELAQAMVNADADAQEILNPLCPCGCEHKRGTAATFGLDDTLPERQADPERWPEPLGYPVRIAAGVELERAPPEGVPRA